MILGGGGGGSQRAPQMAYFSILEKPRDVDRVHSFVGDLITDTRTLKVKLEGNLENYQEGLSYLVVPWGSTVVESLDPKPLSPNPRNSKPLNPKPLNPKP